MARFAKFEKARDNAKANADKTGHDWALFSDTSGGWNSERWQGLQCHKDGVRIKPRGSGDEKMKAK